MKNGLDVFLFYEFQYKNNVYLKPIKYILRFHEQYAKFDKLSGYILGRIKKK